MYYSLHTPDLLQLISIPLRIKTICLHSLSHLFSFPKSLLNLSKNLPPTPESIYLKNWLILCFFFFIFTRRILSQQDSLDLATQFLFLLYAWVRYTHLMTSSLNYNVCELQLPYELTLASQVCCMSRCRMRGDRNEYFFLIDTFNGNFMENPLTWMVSFVFT